MGRGVLPLLIVFLIPVVMSSGCINIDPSTIAMANPLIQGFLEEHPNADIRATHYSAEEAESMLEEIRSDCDNEYIGAKEFYKVNITDPDTDFYAIVWIDWETKNIECAWKLGTSGVEVNKPKEEQGCEHHSQYLCKGGHIYWFDSCGNKEDKKHYCEKGCIDGQEICGEGKSCESHYRNKCHDGNLYWYDSCDNKEEKKMYCDFGCEIDRCIREDESGVVPENDSQDCELHALFKCDGNHVYWYDSCGNKENKKEYCAYGCDGSKCIVPDDAECVDSDGGYNIYEMGIATYGSTSLSDHCNSDGSLTEKFCKTSTEIDWNTTSCGEDYVCEEAACVPYNQSECDSHHTYICYNENVWWYDSCENKEEIKAECVYGCENGECVQQNCTIHANYTCNENEGMIYWYDSCGYMEEVKDQCNGYGCINLICLTQCNDTEEMGDYYVQGTVTDGLGEEWQDYCVSNTSIMEYTCGLAEMVNENPYDCECLEGACVLQ